MTPMTSWARSARTPWPTPLILPGLPGLTALITPETSLLSLYNLRRITSVSSLALLGGIRYFHSIHRSCALKLKKAFNISKSLRGMVFKSHSHRERDVVILVVQ